MSFDALMLASIMLCMVVSFFLQIIPLELTALTGLFVLVIAGYLNPVEAFSGFSSPVVIAMVSMFAVGAALSTTGITEILATRLFSRSINNEKACLILMMILGICFSSFMNNVAAVALLLPVVASVSTRAQIPQSRLLIPLSFATILGGMCTLIGTSTNLIAAEVLRNQGGDPLSLLSFLPFGLSASFFGVMFMALRGRTRLPKGSLRRQAPREHDLPNLYGVSQRLSKLKITPTSTVLRKSLAELGFGHDLGLIVVSIERNGRKILAPLGREVIRDGDLLTLAGDPAQCETLRSWGEIISENINLEPNLSSESIAVFEAVLSPRSRLIGKNLIELGFRERYDCLVLEILRRSSPIKSEIARIPLEFGDALLLQGPRSKLSLFHNDPDFLLMSDIDNIATQRRKAPFVIIALLVFFMLVITQIQSIEFAAFSAALIVLLSGALSTEEFYRTMSWRVVIFLAAIIPLQIVANRSGFPEWISHELLAVAGSPPPIVVLASFLLMGSLVTMAIDPSLTVIFFGPVAIAFARKISIDPHALVLAVTLGASISFASPFSQRANLLVMAIGGYSIRDYLRVGIPMSLLVSVATIISLAVYFNVWF
jgi:di/tricarboxylate transporter